MLQLSPQATAHHTKQIVIPDYQCDIHGELKLSGFLKQIQQISNQHFAQMGFSYPDLLEANIVILLSRMAIRCHRAPKTEELVELRTNPQLSKGAQLLRRIEFWSGEELLAEAQSSWLMVNPQTRRILRPSAFPFAIPQDPSNYDASLDAIKTKCPPEIPMAGMWEREVRYSDLDCNHHLNNTVYGDWVCDLIPFAEMEQKRWKEFAIYYRKEAVAGETLQMRLYQQKEGTYFIEGEKETGSCFEACIRLK